MKLISEDPKEAIYLYCIVKNAEGDKLGCTGIENNPVYIIPYNNIGGVVHRCRAEPYRSDHEDKVKQWVLAHQYVIDLATERFGTVIPATFDTIFLGDDGVVETWLREKYLQLEEMLVRLKGKSEYGIAVYFDKRSIEKEASKNAEISDLRKAMEGKPRGTTYLIEKRVERRIALLRDIEARSRSTGILKEISNFADELKQEKTAVSDDDNLMLLKLSCLVKQENVEALGETLGKIDHSDGFSVTFTGPWPPYSFVLQDKQS